MRLEIKVIPGASRNMLKQEGNITKVYITAPPVDGKANAALVKFLAKYYKINTSAITLIKGEKSRNKVVNIKGKIYG